MSKNVSLCGVYIYAFCGGVSVGCVCVCLCTKVYCECGMYIYVLCGIYACVLCGMYLWGIYMYVVCIKLGVVHVCTCGKCVYNVGYQ